MERDRTIWDEPKPERSRRPTPATRPWEPEPLRLPQGPAPVAPRRESSEVLPAVIIIDPEDYPDLV